MSKEPQIFKPCFTQTTKPVITTDIAKLIALTKKNQKQLSDLWIALSLSNESENNRVRAVSFLSQKLENFKSLSSLTLDLFDFGELKEQDISMLAQSLGSKRSLSVLTICFPEETNDRLIKIFFSSFRGLKKLTSLSLDFSECEQISEEMFKALIQTLKHLRKLKQLSLNFSCCSNIGGRGLTYLFEKLLKSVCLNDLNIILPEIRNDRWLQRLNLSNPESCCNLSSLTLDFSYCEKISQKGIQNLTQILKNNSRSLRSLGLNFGACQGFTDVVLKDLYFSFRELKVLSNLEVRLNPSPETDRSLIQTLFESLNELKESLKNLALTLSELYKVEEREMKALLSYCKELKNLEILSIELSNWEDINDKELENLSYCFGELSSLSTLMINFDKSSRVTLERFNSLATNLKGLSNLASISFNNDECKIVNGVPIKNISLVEC